MQFRKIPWRDSVEQWVELKMMVNDIILTGTPKGSVDTKIGDEVVTEVEGVGRLVNTIVGEDYK